MERKLLNPESQSQDTFSSCSQSGDLGEQVSEEVLVFLKRDKARQLLAPGSLP